MLDVRRMKVLREVAARGSFSAAAEALSFTQSAISQQVAALERETGTKLVERGARGIRLTQAGEVLVKHTDAVLCRLSSAEEELQALAGLREPDPARPALDELRARLAFERGDLLRDRGLRERERLSGSGERAPRGDLSEDFHAAYIEHEHSLSQTTGSFI